MKKSIFNCLWLGSLFIITSCELSENVESLNKEEADLQVVTVNEQEILHFKDVEIFTDFFNELKNKSTEEVVKWANQIKFASLALKHSNFEKDLQELYSGLKDSDNQDDFTQEFQALIKHYDKFVDVGENGQIEYRYKDFLMSSFLNEDRIVIIGNTIFQYSAESIYSIPVEENVENALDILMNNKNSQLVSNFTVDKNVSNAKNDDIYSKTCGDLYSCYCVVPPWEYTIWKYEGNIQVNNSYTPIYDRVWVPGYCEPRPHGEICFPGVWQTVLVGYELANTRLTVTFRGKRRKCGQSYCDWHQYDMTHAISVHYNGQQVAQISSNNSNSDWFKDYAPSANGNASANFNVTSSKPLDDCFASISW
jgi:hypothetical protein